MFRQLRLAIDRRRYPQRYGWLDELLRIESLSPEALRAAQGEALRAMVAHAVAHTPFYRQKFAGQGLEDFAALPILTKAEVIAHREAMVDEQFDRRQLKLAHTGGSTGQPLAYYYHREKHELMRAGMMRSYRWCGWRPGERILNLWGARQDLKAVGGGVSWRKGIGDFISGERTLGAWELDEARLGQWAQRIRDYRPALLQGYASILAALANHVLARRIPMPRGIRGVYCTAEVLYEPQREAMERAFGAKVFNQYGCREVPNIAVECPQGNQHVLTDMVHLESIREGGEELLLVTSLTNRVMPFIRYRLGDAGRLKEGGCPCGRPFPLMEMGHCRSNDLIRTPDGRRIYPSFFIHLLDGLEGIAGYQFVQTAPERIVLNLVAGRPLPAGVAAGLGARLRSELDPRMTLEVRHLGQIPRSASGKHRFVICELG
jgi:phenylacetate-CoA ligase